MVTTQLGVDLDANWSSALAPNIPATVKAAGRRTMPT